MGSSSSQPSASSACSRTSAGSATMLRRSRPRGAGRTIDARVQAARAIRDAADAVKAADARRDADERRAKKRDKRRRHHSFFHQVGF